MKTLKRNAVIIAVLLFVCAAVYLNWSNNQEEQVSLDGNSEVVETGKNENDKDGSAEDGTSDKNGIKNEENKNSGLFYTEDESTATSSLKEYFDTVRLNRKQARDEAAETLNTVAAADGASQEVIDNAINQMATIAAWTLQESELENMIMAKGFSECVAYISEDGISVTVAAPEGLSSADVAKITDIVLTETEFIAEQLKIVEIK